MTHQPSSCPTFTRVITTRDSDEISVRLTSGSDGIRLQVAEDLDADGVQSVTTILTPYEARRIARALIAAAEEARP